jgi:asparaginyl-tRNA synthetase
MEEYKHKALKDIGVGDIGQKLSTFGWISMVRGLKTKRFVNLTAQFKTMKCVFEMDTSEKRACLNWTKNTSMRVCGVARENRRTEDMHLYPFEFHIQAYEIVGGKAAPGFQVEKSSTNPRFIFDNMHLFVREPERQLFLKTRAKLLRIIREYYHEKDFLEVTPPTLVQTQVEGGSTLFEVKYFDDSAYLTQSSQLYLETVVPVAMKAYCISPAYRAERSRTARHLSEYTHVEAEMADIVFEDLLSEIEDLIVHVVARFRELCRKDILAVFPDYVFPKIPSKPFVRVTYEEAIRSLVEHGDKRPVYREETEAGQLDDDEPREVEAWVPYEMGDDIPDSGEAIIQRRLGKGDPMFLTKFPAHLKSFYMEKCGEDRTYTNSCDLLYPGVGETVGGSMRIHNHDELIEAFKTEGISPGPYKFYTDQALYGPCSHGGYGLGFERLCMGILGERIVPNVRYACLYHRVIGRCRP